MKFNPDEVLPYWCNRTAFLFRSILEQRAETLGVKWAEGAILLKMSAGHNTLADLTRHLEHSHPAILRHVDRLEEMGLIERAGHPDDRRIKVLTMTEAGQQKAALLQEMLLGFSSEIQERFGKERVAETIDLMKNIFAAYSNDDTPWCPAMLDSDANHVQAGHA